MGDRIGVMRAGRMAQVGTPVEIYERPVDRFVAEFMGVGNLWDCIVRPDGLSVQLPGIDNPIRIIEPLPPGPAVLGLRAERIAAVGTAGWNQLTGVRERTIYAGDTVTHSVRLKNNLIAAVTEPAHAASCSETTMTLSFAPEACLVFPA